MSRPYRIKLPRAGGVPYQTVGISEGPTCGHRDSVGCHGAGAKLRPRAGLLESKNKNGAFENEVFVMFRHVATSNEPASSNLGNYVETISYDSSMPGLPS